MLLLSHKARRAIDAAVMRLADPDQRRAWHDWATLHPQMRRQGDPAEDSGPRIPREVAAIAIAALEREASELRHRLNSGLIPEDDAFLAENDLTFLGTVESALIRDLAAP